MSEQPLPNRTIDERPTHERPFPDRSIVNRQWIIGCDDDVDVRIRDPIVSRRHCRLSLHQGHFFIEDLASRNGTFLGQDRVVTRHEIQPGTLIMLAGSIPMPWPDESLAKEIYRIGRAATNNIVLDDESVSTNHAILFRDPNDIWLIRDLGSTNGTRLNETKIFMAAHLSPADGVHIGSVAESLSSLRRLANSGARAASDTKHGVTEPAKKAGSSHTTKKSLRQSFNESPTTIELKLWARDQWQSLPSVLRYILPLLVSILVISTVAWLLKPDSTIADPDRVVTESGVGMEVSDATSTHPINRSVLSPEKQSPLAEVMNRAEDTNRDNQTKPNTASRRESIQDFEAAVRGSLYWITCESGGNRFKIGSALAVDQQRLISSAKIIEVARELGQSLIIECCHVESSEAIAVKESTWHPKWVENQQSELRSIKALREIQESAPESTEPNFNEWQERRAQVYRSVLGSQMLSRVYAVGLLKTQTQLPNSLASYLPNTNFSDWLKSPQRPLRPMSKHRMIGSFFDPQDSFVDSKTDVELNWTPATAVPLFLLPRITQNMPRMYVGKVSTDAGKDWEASGASIISRSGTLAGLLSQSVKLHAEQKRRYQSLLTQQDRLFDWVAPEVILELLMIKNHDWKIMPVSPGSLPTDSPTR